MRERERMRKVERMRNEKMRERVERERMRQVL